MRSDHFLGRIVFLLFEMFPFVDDLYVKIEVNLPDLTYGYCQCHSEKVSCSCRLVRCFDGSFDQSFDLDL